MPKFLVTSGSYFEPMTYDEIVKPLAQMAEAQNATQDVYDTLGMETAALEAYLSENEDDQRARALYNDYRQKLENLQNNLWGNGYTPQTRRDLYLAKTAYANNINPIKDAVERRQKLSEAFWNDVHNNPDLIVGRDPGTYGLDNYLDNKEFGNDWYSYSGKDFMNQVGIDAKARVSEMIHSPEISKDPRLVGYLREVEKKGLSSLEIEAGAALVNGDKSLYDKLDDESKYGASIAASVLQSHLESTGAKDKVSPEQYNRLVKFGKAGLSQMIGDTTIKTIDDKVYDEQRDMRKLARQHSDRIAEMDHEAKIERENAMFDAWIKSEAAKNGSGNNGRSNKIAGSENMGSTAQFTSPGYEDYVRATASQSKYFNTGDHTLTIIGKDGKTAITATDEYDLADKVYGTAKREQIRRAFNGYDIALSPKDNGNDGRTTWLGANGDTIDVIISKATDEEKALYNLSGYGKDAVIVRFADDNTVWNKATETINDATKELNEQVDAIKKNNSKTGNIDRMLVTPKQQKKLREDNGYDARASWSAFHDYANQKNYTARRSSISVTGFEHYNDDARKNMGSALASTYRNNYDNISKDSPLAIHIVGSDNISLGEGITDYGLVLGRKDGALLSDSVTDVSAFLEDLVRGKGAIKDGSDPMVRFQVESSDRTFATSPLSFGTMANYQLNGKTDMISVPQIGDYGHPYTLTQEIAYCLWPVFEPDLVRSMSDKESSDWGWRAWTMLGGGNEFPSVSYTASDGTRTRRPYSAKEIMSNPDARDKMYQLTWTRLGKDAMDKFLEAINK